MAISAVANGGAIPAGGVVATLQSAGAAGLGLGTKVAIVTTVTTVSGIIEYTKILYITTMDRRYLTVYVLFVLLVTPVQGEAEQGRQKGWTWDDVWRLTEKYGVAVVLGAAVASSPVLLGAGVAVIAEGSLVKLGLVATYTCYLEGLCVETLDDLYSNFVGGKGKERKED
ncbi:unnamed protein product [Mytilus coruscus]|uniref:Uncharacterized protein n=1 Tax=Mytilus coruscus TaxID=42192 RepID=A0A6J8EB08_MYTCO|nr:unnamed protein product [Mytilus coruscus]